MEEKISIDELNNAIEELREEGFDTGIIEWHFIEFASEQLMRKADFRKKPTYIKLYSHEEAIGIILKFFESLGVKKWFEDVKSILLLNNNNIGINIFNYSDIQDFNVVNKNGMRVYSMGSSIESRIDDTPKECIIKNPKQQGIIRIATNNRFLNYPIDELTEGKVTIEDIQSIIHEIGHTFDLSNDIEAANKRHIIKEIAPFCFEGMFRDFLMTNQIVNRTMIDSMNNNRMLDVLYHARVVYTAISLMQMQEHEGRITKEGINKFLQDKGIYDINLVRDSFMDVIDLDYDLDEHIEYLISGLASTSFLSFFRKNSNQAISNLEKYCQCLFDGNVSDKTLQLVNFPQSDDDIREAIDEFISSERESR